MDGVRTDDAGSLYQAARAQRSELRSQREQLMDQREATFRELSNASPGGVLSVAARARIDAMDARIAELEKQIMTADAEVARLAGMPGAVEREPTVIRTGWDDENVALTWLGSFAILIPLTYLLARRRFRRTLRTSAPTPDVGARLDRIEQALDTVAIEVERMSEGQRFIARVMTERPTGIGAGPAHAVPVGEREAVPATRGER